VTLAEALRTYLQAQFQKIEMEEAGIIAAADPEHLHRFRVALRRSRSLLGEMRSNLVPELEDLRRQMAEVACQTNVCRDADVLLAQWGHWQARLPDFLAPGLGALEKPLRQRRDHAHRQVVALLRSPEYHAFKENWRRWLSQPPDAWMQPGWDDDLEALLERRIQRRRRRLGKRLTRLNAQIPPDCLHQIRIAVKKLRYLMEFALITTEKKRFRKMIERIRPLQDRLGRHHDAAVQGIWLRQIFLESSRLTRRSAAALGWLLHDLDRRQRRIAAKFCKKRQKWLLLLT